MWLLDTQKRLHKLATLTNFCVQHKFCDQLKQNLEEGGPILSLYKDELGEARRISDLEPPILAIITKEDALTSQWRMLHDSVRLAFKCGANKGTKTTPSTSKDEDDPQFRTMPEVGCGKSPLLVTLQPLKPRSFGGNPREWRPFQEEFTALVLNGPYMDGEKMAYLSVHISENAHKIIKGNPTKASSLQGLSSSAGALR